MKDVLLKYENVSYSYSSGVEALHDVSFSMQKGERIALLGLNGAGKSTLMLHANGLLLPAAGRVLVCGMVIDKKHLAEARRAVGMVFQNADDQLFSSTLREDVAFGPANMQLPREEIKSRVEEALELCGIKDLADRAPYQLSGGQKRMGALATVLSMRPDLLVLDEPTSGLDFRAEARFLSVMESLNHSLLMSTHNLELARRLCTRAIVMHGGSIVYDGDIQNVPYPSIL